MYFSPGNQEVLNKWIDDYSPGDQETTNQWLEL